MTRGADRRRARDLGLPFDGRPGPANAITDVAGVEIGYSTLIRDAADRAVRTGVTAIHPRGRQRPFDPAIAAIHAFNGNGELTGSHWVADSGMFTGPVVLTNTHSVGIAHHATCRWLTGHPSYVAERHQWCLPVVGETCDAWLNDINGYHVTEDDVFAALDGARGGAIAEGNVGGGTGMICYEFKGGSGTASRRVDAGSREFVVGVFVQANFGSRPELTILGQRLGRQLPGPPIFRRERGSIIAVIATDAPLIPTQLDRIARRATLGMARTGTSGGDGSGDIFLAFSTAAADAGGAPVKPALANADIDALFEAAAGAVEEAIVNSLVAARDMTGHAGHAVDAIDHRVLESMFRQGPE